MDLLSLTGNDLDRMLRSGRPELVCAADVAPEPVRWLWPERVPLGKVSLVVGDPGCGKSLLALDMAARVTRGLPWPDACATGAPTCHSPGATGVPPVGVTGQGPVPPATSPRSAEGGCALSGAPLGCVVLLSAEDDLADTIRPRFDAAGGEAGRLVQLRAARRGEGRRGFSLAGDLDALRLAIEETGEVRLVILDPLTAYLGGMSGHSNTEVRNVLGPLADLAEEADMAVVAVTHMNKNARLSLLHRTMGSVGFIAASRAVWGVLPDREEAGRMLFAPLKCNLAERPTALAFRIVRSALPHGAPFLAWEPEPVEFDPWDEARRERVPRDAQWRMAAEWLRELLAKGPVPCQEAEALAAQLGIPRYSLLKAKRSLGVVAERDEFAGAYLWRLATQVQASQPDTMTVPPLAEGGSAR